MFMTALKLSAAEASLPTSPANAISLDVLVADVLENNPEHNFYRAEITAANGELRTAGMLANPELSTTIGNKHLNAGGTLSDGPAWSASVRQTFEWPGRMGLRKAIANHQIKLAELGFQQFKVALAARARLLTFELFAAQEKAAAAREVAERFQALRETLVQRDPAGLTPLLETRIIEATELTVRKKSTESLLAEQAAQLEINQLRGTTWTNTSPVRSPALTFSTLPETEVLLAAARTNNFEIRMREAELEMQGFRVSLAKNEKYPAVTVGPYFSQEHSGDRETQIGVGVSIPLPIWNRNAGRIETEEARRTQAETVLFMARRNLERQVMEEALAYQARVDALAQTRADAVHQFKEAALLADRHYRLGAVPIATYVELQKQYLEAVEALLNSKKEALDAAQQLQVLTGLAAPLVTENPNANRR